LGYILGDFFSKTHLVTLAVTAKLRMAVGPQIIPKATGFQ
jgi:hypothetical protein